MTSYRLERDVNSENDVRAGAYLDCHHNFSHPQENHSGDGLLGGRKLVLKDVSWQLWANRPRTPPASI